jgi:hypothetical protein
MNYNNILLLLIILTYIILGVYFIVINTISSDNYKIEEYIFLLLILTFIIISVLYIMSVLGIYKIPIREDFLTIGGDNSDNTCSNYLRRTPTTDENIKTTYDSLKIGIESGEYHTDYTCKNNFVGNNEESKYSTDMVNTADISRGDMLLAYMCISKSPRDLHELLKNNMILNNNILVNNKIYTSRVISYLLKPGSNPPDYKGEIDSGNYDDLENHIISQMNMEKNNLNKVNGPVYICISQSPHIYQNKENMEVTFAVIKHGKSCYEDGKECNKNLYLEYILIYPNKNNDVKKIDPFIEIIKKNKSNSSLCWLNCNSDKIYGCGCLTQDGTKEGIDYISKCVPSDTEEKNNPGIKDYSIIYFINPYMLKAQDMISSWKYPQT